MTTLPPRSGFTGSPTDFSICNSKGLTVTCYHPLTAVRNLRKRTTGGKFAIEFPKHDVEKLPPHLYEPLKLPCGQCIGCRIRRSRDWAIRCLHESLRFEENCFITLTFNSENLDRDASLRKEDFQLFIKRLRKRFRGSKAVHKDGEVAYPIRYFHCGEYGLEFERPHHHACLFNFDFDDREYLKTVNGVKIYTSETLSELWSVPIRAEDCRNYKLEDIWERNGKYYARLGFVTVGDVTIESAAYVARYIMKKVNGDAAPGHYAIWDDETGEVVGYREPEYTTMSRRPGIGREWIDNYASDLYPKDYTTWNGKKFQAPRYYDRIFEEVECEAFREIKKRRKANVKANEMDNTPQRLAAKEAVKKAQIKTLHRGYENDSEIL